MPHSGCCTLSLGNLEEESPDVFASQSSPCVTTCTQGEQKPIRRLEGSANLTNMAQELRNAARQPDVYLIPPAGDFDADFEALQKQCGGRMLDNKGHFPCGICEKQLPNSELLVILAANYALERQGVPLLCTSAVFVEGVRSNNPLSLGQWHLECRYAYPHRGFIERGESCRLSPRTMEWMRGILCGGGLVDCSYKRMASHETRLLPKVPETAEAKEACLKLPATDGWLYFERQRDYTNAILMRYDCAYCPCSHGKPRMCAK
ncbi:uncharacterized protein LOC117648188 [Thrips palmi]|uniref:Uncharacterized protein LOC117648188 n=1 Tax=Thrips palmi TaxID=161013 RepID=A0A6P8ZCJ6_THRPL|nr:uncharacterized protein LOC117648188 [Thrips palmi]